MRYMLSPRTLLKRNKLRLEALRKQEYFPKDHRIEPEQLYPFITKIEDCIRRAEAMLPDTFNFEVKEDYQRLQDLIDFAHVMVEYAFHSRSIMRDVERQIATQKDRKKSWLGLRAWILEQPISLKPEDLFCLLPTESEISFYDFERGDDRVYDRSGKSIGKKRFLNIVSEVRHPSPPG
jgi:hypothetical protein